MDNQNKDIEIPEATDKLDAEYAGKLIILTEVDLAAKRRQKAQALAVAATCDFEIAQMEAFISDVKRRAAGIGFPVAPKKEDEPAPVNGMQAPVGGKE